MKRFVKVVSVVLCMALCLMALGGCVSRDDTSSSSMTATPTPTVSPTPSPTPTVTPSPMPSPSTTPDDTLSSGSQPTAAAGSADFAQIGALESSTVTWGPGTQVNDQNRPTAPLQLQAKFGSYNCSFIGPEDQKVIYLTFDQGYENGYTTKILDVLKDKQVPAVFFLTGHYVNTSGDLIKRMIAEGHTLGNHSNRHYDATEIPLEQAAEDMKSLNQLVRDQFQYECRLYRFPEGKFSEQTLALADQMGLTTLFWSFAYNDWNPDAQPEPTAALEKLKTRLHNGAIYLLHSVSSTNAQILGDFIDYAKAQGYEFRVYA